MLFIVLKSIILMAMPSKDIVHSISIIIIIYYQGKLVQFSPFAFLTDLCS